MNLYSCYKCGKEKTKEDFYKSKSFLHREGLGKICKECKRIEYRGQRERNKETFLKKDSKYYQKNKEEISLRRKKWYEKNKVKVSAHGKLKTAVFKGLIVRKPCEVCGEIKTDAHHDDYNKPLDVRWLCRKHHLRHHAQ